MESVREFVLGVKQTWHSGSQLPLHKVPMEPSEKTLNGIGHIPRRLIRVSNRPLMLLVVSIVSIPALLTLAVFNGNEYISDLTEDVVALGGAVRLSPAHLEIPNMPAHDSDSHVPGSTITAAILKAAGKMRPGRVDDEAEALSKQVQGEAKSKGYYRPQIPQINREPIFDESGRKAEEHMSSYMDEESRFMDGISQPPPGNHRLVILLPADDSGSALCKVIFSGMALGYPSPVILNWHKDTGKTEERAMGGSHLAKITGALEYLEAVTHPDTHEGDRLRDNDLVVLVDAYDVWWQLPPDVLIKRYHEANRVANERLARQWGGFGRMPMKQTIVTAVQKRCWPTPEMAGNRHCEELPESTARSDLYGENTDIEPEYSPREKNKHHDTRPKYFNSGTIMGPVGDMKRYVRRVKERMEQLLVDHPFLWSDQAVFADVFGEQEVWRTWLRSQRRAFPYDEATKMMHERFEYSIGLDYSQQLFVPTVFEEEDGEMLELHNETRIAERSAQLGIDPVRLRGVPEDLRAVEMPLKKVVAEEDHDALDWGEVPLYADFFSEAVPVAVHHNAHEGGLKERRIWWWDRTWYFPYLRDLVEAFLEPPARMKPLAKVPTGRQGKQAVYWPLSSDRTKRKPRRFAPEAREGGFPEMEFEMLCRERDESEDSERRWFDEVFRDGMGGL